MSHSQSSVVKIYQSVIEDVISGVRDSFLDEGVDEQVLQELKQIWESKLESSKAIEVNPDPPDPQPPQILSHDTSRNNIAPRTAQLGNNIYTYQSAQNAVQHIAQQTNQVAHSAIQSQIQNHPTILQSQQQTHQQPQQHQVQQQIPTSLSLPSQTVIVTDPHKQVPIQLTLQAQGGGERVLTIQVPAAALQGNQLQQVLTGPLISATMALPVNVASSLLQQHVTAAFQSQAASMAAAQLQPVATIQQPITNQQQQQSQTGGIGQLDGAVDTSDEEEEDDDDNDDDDEENEENEEDENEEDPVEGAEEEPLNSEDDVSDEDPTDLFDTDNVVVCQYDKITRSRNKWKFYLKDGIMNLNGKDFVFQKASGDAEW